LSPLFQFRGKFFRVSLGVCVGFNVLKQLLCFESQIAIANYYYGFDRGLITIDAGYRVKVSAGVIQDAGHLYSLKQFNGLPIHLPADRRYYPNPANLAWHGGNVFKGN
jgi:predicted restriction endonuclease